DWSSDVCSSDLEPLPRDARDLLRPGAWAVLILSVLLLIVYQSQSLGVGLAMAAGIGGTLLLLWLAARAAARLLRRSPRGGLPYTVRPGVAKRYRPGHPTVTRVGALGFCAFLTALLVPDPATVQRPLNRHTA